MSRGAPVWIREEVGLRAAWEIPGASMNCRLEGTATINTVRTS